LQEKAIIRVGGDRTIPIDCRLIAATNRNLNRAVDDNRFRRDLLYRLNVITIELPPLRKRREDIPFFINRFVQAFAERNNKVVDGLVDEVMERLMAYDWPGNVRELENAIEHVVAMVKGRRIDWEDLPAHLQVRSGEVAANPEDGSELFELANQEYEMAARKLFIEALRAEKGDIPSAAQLLGMSRATLYRRLKKYDLQNEISKMRFKYQI